MSGERFISARSVLTDEGRRYFFVESPPPRRDPFFGNPRRLILRIIAMLLTAGVLCYWLTRYIVLPIGELRSATRRVADGDLAARVAPALGKRRDELGAMGRDFDRIAERIERLIDAQRRLLSDISHELRSPLARLGVALALARKRGNAAVVSSLDRIELEAAQVNEMIGQILSLSRRENTADDVRRDRVNLARLVRDVVADADFETLDSDRAVEVIDCDDCHTIGDHALLRSAIENVVRNAVRHTPANTAVAVSLKHAKNEAGGQAVITVRDRGTGVPDEALADIFRPFYRVDEGRDRESGGAGLGLAITARAVNLHGGGVSARNAPDHTGLVIEIRLPIVA